jgi:integral membrane protein
MFRILIKSPLGRLRLLAIVEGVSYLLLAITMPLKYQFGLLEPNFFVGMAHGWLFILYILSALQNIVIYQWGFKQSFMVLAASLIPFGTFYLDFRFLKPIYLEQN